MNNPLQEECPNCESAWTGGHPDPGAREWCVICSHPKTGEIRWWSQFHFHTHPFLVSRHNFNIARVIERITNEEAQS